MTETKAYSVPLMHCDHCKAAITEELAAVPSVRQVDVDLESRIVTVTGTQLDDVTMRAAIEEAGYEAEETSA
jgi:copper chaperone CopZ